MVESLNFSGHIDFNYVLPTASTVTLGGVKVDGTTIHITNGVISATAGTGGVTSFNTRTGAVTLSSGDVTTALGFTPASLASPVFTGNPTAPTPSPGDNDTSLATTAFVTSAVVAATTGVASFNTRTGTVTLTSGDVTTALGFTPAGLSSPALTGNPTAPTASPGDNDTSIATTAFVTAAVSASTAGVASFNTRTGTVTLTSGDVTGALTYTPYNATNPTGYQTAAQVSSAIANLAPLASPAFTGNPTGPTASPGDNDTSLATTAFVTTAVAAATVSGSGGMTTTWFNALPTTTGSAGPWWNDGGLLAFDSTWGGASNDPSPTAYVGSFNTRTGSVTLSSGDVTTALGFTPQTSAQVSTAVAGEATRAGGVEALLARGHVSGFTVSRNSGTPTTRLDLAPGVASDEVASAMLISSGSVLTINAATTGANGMDTGALTNNTWYAVFVIGKADGTVAGFLSTSLTPTLPATYTLRHRLAMWRTNGSAQFIAATQNGDTFTWAVPVSILNAVTSGATTAQTVGPSTGIPVAPSVEVIAVASVTNVSALSIVIYSSLDTTDTAASVTNFTLISQTNNFSSGHFRVRTDASGNFRLRNLNSADVNYLIILGWVDTRGKDS